MLFPMKGPPPNCARGATCKRIPAGFPVENCRASGRGEDYPLKILPLQDLLLEPVGLFHTKDFGDYVMVRAANMKITIDKNDLRIVIVSGVAARMCPFWRRPGG